MKNTPGFFVFVALVLGFLLGVLWTSGRGSSLEAVQKRLTYECRREVWSVIRDLNGDNELAPPR